MLMNIDFHTNATRINIRYFHWLMVIPENITQSCRNKKKHLIVLILTFPTNYCFHHLHLHKSFFITLSHDIIQLLHFLRYYQRVVESISSNPFDVFSVLFLQEYSQNPSFSLSCSCCRVLSNLLSHQPTWKKFPLVCWRSKYILIACICHFI